VGPTSQKTWDAFLHKTFGAMAPRFARMYPAITDAQRTVALRRVHCDLGLASLYSWTQLWLAHGPSPVYVYLWEHVEPGHDSARWLAFHSSEIPYVFETLDKAPERNFTTLDMAISRRMSQYWVNFVKTGDPNEPGLPKWPELHRADPIIMGLGDRMKPRQILPSAKLSAMKAFMASGGRPNEL
jgi:para-nitrobenzyl esterase